jgi:hypothetical protein
MRMRVAGLLAFLAFVTTRPGLGQSSESRGCSFRSATTCWTLRIGPPRTVDTGPAVPDTLVRQAPAGALASKGEEQCRHLSSRPLTDSSGRCTALRPRGSRRGASPH